LFLIWLLTAILYGGTPVIASAAESATARVPNVGAANIRPEDYPPAVPQPLQATTVPHIALLLPLNSGAFARPAQAVETGFLAAAKVQGWSPLPMRTYAVNDDAQQILDGYRKAVVAGARIVVGPLTRDGVTALAGSDLVTVPTLALNVPEGSVSLPRNMYTLSLQVEAEARQVAHLAIREGHVNAITIVGDTPLQRRMHQAFIREFTHLGGKQVAEYSFTTDIASLDRIKQAAAQDIADMVFLALDFQRARVIRPYLNPLPIYATSQVYPGTGDPLAGFDLANVRFLDMPWLLQPDHPAVMIYARHDFGTSTDLDRLYALGIDAFRVAQELLNGRTNVVLDGVSGRITLGRDHRFMRKLVSAQFIDGKLLVSGESGP